jgi:hypothetical protein
VSNIGMIETLAECGDYQLVQTEGSGFAEIMTFEGDHILNVPAEEVGSVAAAFDTFIAMYDKGYKGGQTSGRIDAQFAIRKALGL